jgi:S1-C subfamily serine protease
VVHSSKDLTTDEQGSFSLNAGIKYFYKSDDWVSVIVRLPDFKPSAYLGISGGDGDNGVKVLGTLPKGAAEKAGLQAKDIICEFDGTKITKMEALRDLITKHFAGDEVKLKITRDGNDLDIPVTLGGNQEQVEENGYKFAYASVLSIGEKKVTKEGKAKDLTLKLDFSVEN